MKRRFDKQGGFTLIEVMMVVAILGILAAVAFSSYSDQVTKTRRTDGKIALSNDAQDLERCYTEFFAYNHGSCSLSFPHTSPEGFYTISATRTATTYTLTATPIGAQSDDSCGALSLTHTGAKSASGTGDCW